MELKRHYLRYVITGVVLLRNNRVMCSFHAVTCCRSDSYADLFKDSAFCIPVILVYVAALQSSQSREHLFLYCW